MPTRITHSRAGRSPRATLPGRVPTGRSVRPVLSALLAICGFLSAMSAGATDAADPAPASPSSSLEAGPNATPIEASPSGAVSEPDGVLASIPLVPGLAPAWSVVADGSVWVSSHRGPMVFRIDPETNHVTMINIGQETCGATAGLDKVWLMPCFDNPMAVAVDPVTNRVIGSSDEWPAVFTPDVIWALNYDGHLHEVDPTSLASIRTYDPFQDYPTGWVVSAGGFIWAVAENGNDGSWGGSIAKIDPVAHSIVGYLSVPGVGEYGDVSADFGYIWVKDVDSSTLLRIDPVTEAITKFTVSGYHGLSQLYDIFPSTGLGSVWLRMSDGLVSRVDPATGQVTGTYPADPAGGGGIPVVGFDSLWVPNFGSDTVWRDQVTP